MGLDRDAAGADGHGMDSGACRGLLDPDRLFREGRGAVGVEVLTEKAVVLGDGLVRPPAAAAAPPANRPPCRHDINVFPCK